MMSKRLYILIEGNDDQRFFERIIRPSFEMKYDAVFLWQHAQKTNKQAKRLLKSVKAMKADYIYAKDINLAPCITKRKQFIQQKIPGINRDRIIIVIKEIESWYLAGLNKAICRQLRIRWFPTTDTITKEEFNRSMPKRFDSRIDFMLEILKHFSTRTAKQKNKSFKYFVQKHLSS